MFPAGQLVAEMIDADPAIGAEIIDRSLQDPTCRLHYFLGHAVGALLDARPEEGRSAILRMLGAELSIIRTGGARGLIRLRRPYCAEDVAVLAQALATDDTAVATVAIFALRSWRDMPAREFIPLLLTVEFGTDLEQFENVAGALCNRVDDLVGELRDEEVASLLDRMKPLSRLDGHWAGELLATLRERHGVRIAKMLLDRIDLALTKTDREDYAPIGFAREGGGFRLDQSPDIGAILALIWQWLRDHDTKWTSARYMIGEALVAMFRLETSVVVAFFEDLLDHATIIDLEWIGQLLRGSHHRFIFSQRAFVEHYLMTCKATDPDLLSRAIDQVYLAAVSGSWSGTLGEPLPRDIESKETAEAILASISRLSPAYALYRRVLEDAKRNIAKSLEQGAAYDDDE